MKKKAVYYERVSTDNFQQDSSLENQSLLLEKYLKNHPEVEVVERYSERISGKSDLRPEYQRMKKRLSMGDIDYVLSKDFKRLGRSVEEAYALKNHAKHFGYEFIRTDTGQKVDYDGENRLLFGFEALLNEEVIYRQSAYANTAHQQKMDQKRLNANDAKFGFRWNYDKKDMEIDPEKALVIQRIFEMLVYENKGISEISKIIATDYHTYGNYKTKEEREYAELTGEKKIMASNTIRKWIRDEAYIGNFYFNKRGSILEVGKGVKNHSTRYDKKKDEWVKVERPDLAIIPIELFQLAQRVIDERIHTFDSDKNGRCQDRYKGTHLFSAKVYCGECNCSFIHYFADRKKTVSAYKDSFRLKKRTVDKLKCSNKEYGSIYEDTLSDITIQAINELVDSKEQCFSRLESALEQVLANRKNEGIHQEERIEKEQKELLIEKEKIVRAFIVAIDNDMADMAEEIKGKLDIVKAKLQMLKDEKNNIETRDSETSATGVLERMKEIRTELEAIHHITSIDRTMVNAFVNKIVINVDGTIDIILKTNNKYNYKNKPWEEQKQARKKSASNIIFPDLLYYRNVVKKIIQVMKVLYPRPTPTARRI